MVHSSLYEDSAYDSALAIVGMAGCFPDAPDVQTFWHNIAEGIVSIRSLSNEELLAAGVEPEQLADPNYVKMGAPLEGIDQFDASFFGYTPREAEVMDPQHRLFLECCWQALEQAGYDPYTSREQIGVFAGSAFSSYFLRHLHPDRELTEQLGQLQVDVGNERDSLASTVSYKLNLKGPAVTVQTFCSTSLVAVHLACQSLLNYESDLALGGGVALNLPHGQGYRYEEGSILSPDGVCRAFDARAQGSVMSNGMGVVVLKRLREALEEGDQIYAVVRGSAMNNDGSRRVSYTAPGLEGQANAIQAALSYAQVPAESISYIEAHGTGTKLGDAVELEAMRRVFEGKGQPAARPYCALGSVKPNVGHLDRAAGVSGLIKTVQALRHRQLPPSVNYAQANPVLEGSRAFYVNTQLREWERGETPRRAGVSSFGLGGTNVHLVLEEGPQRETRREEETWQVLPLSARSQKALQEMRARLATYLREGEEEALGNVAYTLQVGRANFGYRSMVVCRERGEAIAQLEREEEAREAVERRDRPVAWVLPGEGALRLADVRDWYAQEASFRQAIDHCADHLRATRGLDLRAFIFSQSDQASAPEWLAHIAFLVTQYALACTLMHQGVQPGALYGSGRAEYIAACLAGVLSLEDALTLIISQFEQRPVAILPASLHAPQIGSISALTGTWVASEQATDPHYWEQERPVDASLSVQAHALLREMGAMVLYVGASYENLSPAAKDALSLLAELDAERSARKALLEIVGELWVRGVTIDWSVCSVGEQRLRVGLPTYPFEHKRYWIDSPEERRLKQRLAGRDASKKLALDDWFSIATWERQPLAAETSTTSARLLLAPVLLFMDESGLSASLAARLTDEGKVVIHVSPGLHYQCLDAKHYVIRPGERNDYLALCQDLQAAQCFPRTIIHAWGVGTLRASSTLLDGVGFEHAQEWGFYSLLWLAQALSKQVIEGTIHVDVIVSRVLSLEAGDTLAPEKAPVLGISKVLSQEYPDIICRVIDIDQIQSPALAAHLLDELSTISSETVVAYRKNERWIQRYQRIQLAPEHPLPKRLRPRGTYLITGGPGAIGLIVAEYLVRTLQANVVLVSRSVLPERALWENWPEQHATTEKVSQQIKRMLALEASGGRILLVQADVARPAQLEAVFRQAEQQFGQIHGVIHAAGISSEEAFKTIPYLERADCELHFQAKVYGLLALEQVVRERSLDFCLLFSSLATVLGGLSLAAYSAANLFLEAFTQQQNQQGPTPWLSVAWDTWQVREEATSVLGATVATYAMSAQEGVEAFVRVLASQGIGHLVQSTGELEARLRQWVRLEGLRLPQGTASAAGSRRVPRGRGEVEQAVQALWQEVLGLPDVGLYENYFDLGGNSLNGLQVMAQLRKLFQVQLPVVTLFEAPTIAALVERILALTSSQPQEAEPASRAEQLRARRKQASQEHEREGIAIVAMTGRFPGARTVEQFWENLRDGVESITVFEEDELRAAGVPAEVVRQPNYVRARPILPEGVVGAFDAAFFGYSPRDAQLLDPQHRLFLECCWEALERAGYDPQGAAEQIGVFGGTNISSYLHQLLRSAEIVEELEGVVNGYQVAISMDKDSLTTAVSYKLNLRGPSLAVQTFCSTSLVAVHLACQSLRRGECDLALAGGVSVHVPVIEGHLYEEGGQESPDGHCRTFDARAGGSMFGDGVGVVVLKRLHEALEDGDQVLAVIRGSAINNDGAGKVSYTAPSVTGQAEVVLDALEDAGVSAESISYVEAHGTATKLGDPIEVAALTKAYRRQTEAVGYCAIGSVKTNIGHLDRAAGVSGLIKTVQALQAEELPASLHYERPNPEIDFASSPFVVNAALRAWPRQEGNPRRAGINSLGMGGTNVHVIVEEAPPREASGASREWQLVVLSAKTATALEQATHQLGAYLAEHEDLSLADAAYTLQVGRQRFEHRRALVCRDRREALQILEQVTPGRVWSHQEQRIDRPVALLFPGLGEIYPGIACELYEQEKIFRDCIDRCCMLLEPYLGIDLRKLLCAEEQTSSHSDNEQPQRLHKSSTLNSSVSPGHKQDGENGTLLRQTLLAQPATFVLEYALVQLLIQWGLQPQAMLGYSIGEYVAACVSGVFSLDDALMIVARRAQLMQELPAGAMLAVAISEDLAQTYLSTEVNLAAVNTPEVCVLAGEEQALTQVARDLEQRGLAWRWIEVTHAFHSSYMFPLRESLTALLQRVVFKQPRVPYLSNVTGTWITTEQATNPDYWVQHMCQPVRLSAGITQLLQESEFVFVEVGAGHGLSALLKQHPACDTTRSSFVFSTLPALHEAHSATAFLLTTLGKLWLAGVSIDWRAYAAGERRLRVLLPTYPFERQQYWIEARRNQPVHISQGRTSSSTDPIAALIENEGEKSANLADWFYLPSWKRSVGLSAQIDGALASLPKQCWLLFADHSDLADRLAAQLRAAGHTVITVVAGPQFAQTEECYTVRADEVADYEAMLKDLREREHAPAHIVHCWAVDSYATTEDNELDEVLTHGFYSLLCLAQALGNLGLDHCQLTVLSSEMQDVSGSEALCAAKATLIGPCKVIPQEYPGITCRSIDLAGSQLTEPGQRTLLLRQVLMELTSGSADAVVAWRGPYRWVQTFEQTRLAEPPASQVVFRAHGVYLITGGLGGIGLAMAEHLAQAVQARLILLGRTSLPPRSEWPALLAADTGEAACVRQVRSIMRMEELGAEIMLVQADVCDEAQMREAVREALETFGALHGVLHIAGVPASGLIQLKTREMAESVLGAKVRGTQILGRVLHGLSLDFLILFSSICSATGGGPGQVDYCAANAFLDAYAHLSRGEDGRTVALDWSEWQWNAWEDGLLGYPQEAQQYFRQRRQRFGIRFEEGFEALRRTLANPLSHIVVASEDFQRMLIGSQNSSITTILNDIHALRAAHAATSSPRPVLGTEYEPPASELEREIAARWGEVLGIEQIGRLDNFFELGGHSLIGMQLLTRLRRAFGVDLRLTTLFEAPTVADLAIAVELLLIDEIERAGGKETGCTQEMSF